VEGISPPRSQGEKNSLKVGGREIERHRQRPVRARFVFNVFPCFFCVLCRTTDCAIVFI